MNARNYQNKLQYWIKWIDWNKNKKFYNATRFDNSLEIVEDFHSCYLDKPRSGKSMVYRSERKRS